MRALLYEKSISKMEASGKSGDVRFSWPVLLASLGCCHLWRTFIYPLTIPLEIRRLRRLTAGMLLHS